MENEVTIVTGDIQRFQGTKENTEKLKEFLESLAATELGDNIYYLHGNYFEAVDTKLTELVLFG